MSKGFHAEQLSHGFFQFTRPFTILGWVFWVLAVGFLLTGAACMLVASGIPDAPPVEEAVVLASPEIDHEYNELGKGFEDGATGAWLRLEGTISEGTIARGDCYQDDDGNWHDSTRAVDEGPLVIKPDGYSAFTVNWTQEGTGVEISAKSRSCPGPGWTIDEGDEVQLFVLDDGDDLWLFSAGEGSLDPSEVTDREDWQRFALLFTIIGGAILMVATPTSLAHDIRNIQKEHSARVQMHLSETDGTLVKAVGAERREDDRNDWILDEPKSDNWNLQNPYAPDKDDEIIEEHPTKIGTPTPATLTFYSIAASIFIISTIWLSSDLLARHGSFVHILLGNILRWGVMIFNIIWAIICFRRWKTAHNIIDTPTQLARSVAVGPAELVGQVRPGPEGSMTVTVKSQSRRASGVVAYEWLEEEHVCRGSGKDRTCSWETRDSGEGSVPFILHDGSAGIMVDSSSWKSVEYGRELKLWESGDWRWTLHTLGIGDPIYCLGRAETKKDGEYEEELDRTQQSSLLVMKGNADVGMSVKLQRGTELSLLSGMRSTTEQLVVPVALLILGLIPFLW